MYAIHPKSAALIRKRLGLADDAPVTVADLYRAADMEAAEARQEVQSDEA